MSYLAYTPKPSYEVLEAAYKDLLVRHGALEQEHSSVQQQIGQYVANLEQHAANHAANLEQHTANLLAEASQQVAALSKKNEELTKKCDQHKLVVKNSNRRSVRNSRLLIHTYYPWFSSSSSSDSGMSFY